MQRRPGISHIILRGMSEKNCLRPCRYGTTSCQPGTTSSAATRKPAQGCATAAPPGKSTHPTGVEQVRSVPLHKHVRVYQSHRNVYGRARDLSQQTSSTCCMRLTHSQQLSRKAQIDSPSRNQPCAVHCCSMPVKWCPIWIQPPVPVLLLRAHPCRPVLGQPSLFSLGASVQGPG